MYCRLDILITCHQPKLDSDDAWFESCFTNTAIPQPFGLRCFNATILYNVLHKMDLTLRLTENVMQDLLDDDFLKVK